MSIDLEKIGSHIVDVAVKLHIELGPGLRESPYAKLMARGLEDRGLHVDRQVTVPFEFKGERFERNLKVDLLVAKQVVVEVKAVARTTADEYKQVLTYLRLM